MNDKAPPKKYLFPVVLLLLLLGIWALWQLKPATSQAAVTPPIAVLPQIPPSSLPATTGLKALQVNGPLPTLAPSLQGTQVDCPLIVDAKGQLVLTVGIRSCFDYFLSSLGEKTETQLIADIRLYLSSTLPKTAQPYAFKLLDQYIAYMHARKQPAGEQAKTLTPESLQAIVDTLNNVRRQFFSPAEIQVFFASDAAYDQFNIDKMKVNADQSLTADQKAKKIAALLDQQPAGLANSIRPLMQYAELQQLTKDIQARGGSAEELHQMRESLVGSAAASRLDQLDSDNSQWQQQVNRYLTARDQLLAGSSDPASQQTAVTALRNQTFDSPEQRLRAQTFESMHDSRQK